MQKLIVFLLLIISIWIVIKHFFPHFLRSCTNRIFDRKKHSIENSNQKASPVQTSYCTSCHHCSKSPTTSKCQVIPFKDTGSI